MLGTVLAGLADGIVIPKMMEFEERADKEGGGGCSKNTFLVTGGKCPPIPIFAEDNIWWNAAFLRLRLAQANAPADAAGAHCGPYGGACLSTVQVDCFFRLVVSKIEKWFPFRLFVAQQA